MNSYSLALDLVDDNKLISEYETYHRQVWPEIEKSIADAGNVQMEIYRFAHGLFMFMEVTEDLTLLINQRPMLLILKCRSGNN